MNFADISKKGNKFHDHKVKKDEKMMNEKNVSKFLNKFSKELVITVGNESVPTNTSFHYGTIGIKGFGAPRGTIFEKSNEPF